MSKWHGKIRFLTLQKNPTYVFLWINIWCNSHWLTLRTLIQKSVGFSSRQDTGTPSGSSALTARCGVTKSNLHRIPCSGNCMEILLKCHTKVAHFWDVSLRLGNLQYTFLFWRLRGNEQQKMQKKVVYGLIFSFVTAQLCIFFLRSCRLNREHLNGASKSSHKIEFSSCCSVLNMELVLGSPALLSQLAESPHLFLGRSQLHHLTGDNFNKARNQHSRHLHPWIPYILWQGVAPARGVEV